MRTLRRVVSSEHTLLILLGALVGVATGYGAALCHFLIDLVRRIGFGEAGDMVALVDGAPPWLILLFPAVGGLLVGPIVFYGAPEARGHGVPEVMDALARRAGRIRPRVVVLKALASCITIGTGGSVGWEGPIIQVGAGAGSTVGQWLRVARRHMRVLVACGAAAGIAATFNAPIAGVLFSLEIFLGDLAISAFTPVVVAAVSGTAVSFAHFGSHGILELPEQTYRLVSVAEIPIYALLGVVCAVAGVAFSRAIYAAEDLFERLPVPVLAKPALGGLGVGALGLILPGVLGVGYLTIEHALRGDFAAPALGALLGLKLLATCLTLGSGGSGGIFAPALVLGALLGSGFGAAAHGLLPGMTALPGVYAVAGMAAFVASTTYAPFSAILILFEMTQDYAIILPLMVACVLASTVARGISRDSIYTLKLRRRGIKLRGGRDTAVLQAITVAETMAREPLLVPESWAFPQLRDAALKSAFHVFPVVDGERRLRGVLTIDDLHPLLLEEGLSEATIAHDMVAAEPEPLRADDDLETARRQFQRTAIDELPVVDEAGRVIGILREHDMLVAYNRALELIE